MFHDDILTAISNPIFKSLVDAFTLLIVLFTALAALRSSRSANEANEIKLLPIFGISFTDNNSRYKFYIENFGEGPAFNIEISPWIVLLTDLEQIWELKMSLGSSNFIKSNGKALISYDSTINGRGVNVSDIMAAHLHPDTSSSLPKVHLKIKFTNAVNHRYFTIIELGKGGPRIIRLPSKFDWKPELTFVLDDLTKFFRTIKYLSLWKIKKSNKITTIQKLWKKLFKN